jgi:hypothetical protein
MNESIRWIDEVRGNDSLRGAARKAGITSAKLIRQVNDDLLTFETVRDISRAYGRSVVADLISTGHLSRADAGAEGVERVLRTASDEDLVLEVARRMEVTSIGTIYDKPISEAVTEATIHQMPTRGNVPTPDEDRALAASDDVDWQVRQEQENE